MNILRTTLLFLSFCLMNCQQTQKRTPIPPSAEAQKLEEYFNSLTALKQFNGGVLVAKHDTIIFKQAFNIFEDTAHSAYITTAHQFDVRSVSKLMAKSLIIDLEKEGKLNRQQSIDRYFPNFPKGGQITLQHLLDHRSGLPRELSIEVNLFELETDSITRLIEQEALLYEPDTDSRYSNLGYHLLYDIIGQVSGKAFAQHLQEKLFDSLHMKNSGAHFQTDRNNLHHFAPYHELDGKEVVNIPHFNKDDNKQNIVFSTLDDLHLFLQHLENKRYATELQDDAGIIRHSGGSNGIRAHVQTNLKEGYHFIFLANYDEIPHQQIIRDMVKIIEGKPYEIPKALNRKSVQLAPSLLQEYAGNYRVKEFNGQVLNFKVEQDSLVLYQHGERNEALLAENDSTFFFDPTSSDSFRFQKENGQVTKMIMKWKGVDFIGMPIED